MAVATVQGYELSFVDEEGWVVSDRIDLNGKGIDAVGERVAHRPVDLGNAAQAEGILQSMVLVCRYDLACVEQGA